MAALFLPLDVDYADDPALEEAGERSELLYIRARCAMKSKESDGFLSHLQLKKLGLSGAKTRADRLVEVGLWERTDTGYYDPRFLEDNPSAAELSTLRANKQRGGVLGNHIRWHRDGRTEPDCSYCSTDRTSDRSSDRTTVAKGRERNREDNGQGTEPTATGNGAPSPDPSSLSSPSPSPDLARGYMLLGEYQGELSDKQLGILDEWTAERGGSADWLAAVAVGVPADFYATASQEHRTWRRTHKGRKRSNGWTPSPADLAVIEGAHR